MPATVNVNFMTVVHAGSTGMSISFPDVCKTPSPAGPIPIPYPNIAQSSDTADGSSTVKIDGNPIMLKSSNFRMSTGDEAGAAMGVISNKIKGKAEPLNASFDVKVDGKAVFRLTDPMKTNAGSNNTVSPAELQAPIVVMPNMSETCEALKKKEKSQTKTYQAKQAGMPKSHFDKISQVVKDFNVVIYFRATEAVCEDWILQYHQPKPHKIFKGNTIKEKTMGDGRSMVEWAQDWLTEFENDLKNTARRGKLSGAAATAFVSAQIANVSKGELLGSNKRFSNKAERYLGVIGGTRPGDKYEPLKYVKGVRNTRPGGYYDKWVTGDYDIFHIIYAHTKCKNVGQDGKTFSKLRKAINKALQWDAIQHGPQTQWIANAHDVELGAPKGTNFPKAVKKGFAEDNAAAEMEIPGRKPMKVFDEKVTVIAPGGSIHLKTQQDTFDAMKCRECDKK